MLTSHFYLGFYGSKRMSYPSLRRPMDLFSIHGMLVRYAQGHDSGVAYRSGKIIVVGVVDVPAH
jgi:hypothetical protein